MTQLLYWITLDWSGAPNKVLSECIVHPIYYTFASYSKLNNL